MGFIDRKKNEEQPGGGSGLELDLELRACSTCRRDLYPWEAVCPADGGEAVLRTMLSAPLPPPPAHLLTDDEESRLPEEKGVDR